MRSCPPEQRCKGVYRSLDHRGIPQDRLHRPQVLEKDGPVYLQGQPRPVQRRLGHGPQETHGKATIDFTMELVVSDGSMVEVPLSHFVRVNPAFNPTLLRQIRFRFDRTRSAVIILDRVGFVQEHQDWQLSYDL